MTRRIVALLWSSLIQDVFYQVQTRTKVLKQSPSAASMDEGFLDYPHLRQHYQKVKYQGQLCAAPIWVPF